MPLAAIFKRSYGQAGLSAQLWRMERSDVGNYRRLLLKGYITRAQLIGLAALSLAKFARRFVFHTLTTGLKK
jgi:hypothetical protein